MAGRGPSRLFLLWVAGLILLTACAGVVYAVAQQATRRGVEDVPRALVTHSRDLLAQGRPPSSATSGDVVDLANNDMPFTIIYDDHHTVLASSATLSGSVPSLPPGVLDAASATGEDRVTWQPAPTVREAVVAQAWHSPTQAGVVVAGTSLAPAEARTALLGTMVAVCWLSALIAITAAAGVTARRHRL